MAWLRSNVVAGIVTAAILGAIAAAWAIPVRLADVEQVAGSLVDAHHRDVLEIRARHALDLDGVGVRFAAGERVDASVVQMLETVQMQITSVQHLVEAQIALEARSQGLTREEDQ